MRLILQLLELVVSAKEFGVSFVYIDIENILVKEIDFQNDTI
jgi:hypothetical protein